MIAQRALDFLASLPYFRGKGSIALQIMRAFPNAPHTALLPFGGRLQIGLDTMRQSGLGYWIGKYETAVVRVFCDELARLNPQASVMDLGANIGFYTVIAAAALGVRGNTTVHSFEPNPTIFAELERNIAVNKFTNVRAQQAGVGDVTSEMTLYVNPSAITYSSLRRTEEFLKDEIHVPVITLDEYAAQQGIGKIGLIKMDVEGAELLALKGGAQLLARDKPTLIYEEYAAGYQQFGYTTRDVRQFLNDLGYQLFAIPEYGRNPKLEPITIDGGGNAWYQNVLAKHR
jgi:FkbM family methyltransferase